MVGVATQDEREALEALARFVRAERRDYQVRRHAIRWRRRTWIALFVVAIPSGAAAIALAFADRWPALPPVVGNPDPEPLLAGLVVALFAGGVPGGLVALAVGMMVIAWRIVSAGLASDPHAWAGWAAAFVAYAAVLVAYRVSQRRARVVRSWLPW